MTDPAIERLNDARTEGVARVDEAIEPGSPAWEAYTARIDELLRVEDDRALAERHPVIWAKSFERNEPLIDDPEKLIELNDLDLMAVPELERSKEWQNTVEAFADAASSQAWAEHLCIPTLAAVQKSTVILTEAAAAAGPDKIRKAEAPGKQRYKEAKERRRARAAVATD